MDKYKYISLLKEMDRRREEKAKRVLETYNANPEKLHLKQLDFHKDTHRNRWLFGGNRTGKTVAGAVETVWYARGNHPFKKIRHATRGWVVSLTNEVQRDVAQKEILKWLNPDWIKKVEVRKGEKSDPKNAIIDYLVVESIWGGESIISFKVCEQGRAKFQGTSQHYIWFDEEPPKDIYTECKMRVVDTEGDMWGTMTPLMGLTWVYDLIYLNKQKDKEVKYWFMQWADNPYLSKKEIEQLESTMTKEEREARQYGKFVALSGLVYKEFNEEIHVIEPFQIDKEWYYGISIDPGYNHPLSCHFYAVDYDGNIYVIAEHYKRQMTVREHAKRIHKIADELGWKRTKRGYLNAMIDSAALQKTLQSEKSVVEIFEENGISCDTEVNKSKLVGIQRVKEYLELQPNIKGEMKPKLFIFATCVEMINEFKTYRWAPNTTGSGEKDEPEKENDHALDELRYIVMTRPALKQREAEKIYNFEIEKPNKNKGDYEHITGSSITTSFLDYN